MKSCRNLWPEVTSFENLFQASRKAERGKRDKPDVAAFSLNMERELWRLKEELETGSYRPGPYRVFEVVEPKRRVICAAEYRDRVVHHALCNVIEPIFDRRFIFDNYANRVGKGTHKGLERFTRFLRRNRYVLKCDIEKFFPSIDHEILLGKIGRVIRCGPTMGLVRLIVNASPQIGVTNGSTFPPGGFLPPGGLPAIEPPGAKKAPGGVSLKAPLRCFPGDDLFTPLDRRKGLPIGNLTSQLFASIYMNDLDHFVKELLRVRDYVRYMDDFAIFPRPQAPPGDGTARGFGSASLNCGGGPPGRLRVAPRRDRLGQAQRSDCASPVSC